MEEYHENYVKQLSHLLSICNDGKEGYKKAAEEVHSAQLKEIFLRNSADRERMAEELKIKIRQFGGHANDEKGDNVGKLHRTYMAFKTALASRQKDDQAVLQSVRGGEEAALEAYDDVLQGEILNTSLKPFLTGQRTQVSQNFYEIDKIYFSEFKTSPDLNL